MEGAIMFLKLKFERGALHIYISQHRGRCSPRQTISQDIQYSGLSLRITHLFY